MCATEDIAISRLRSRSTRQTRPPQRTPDHAEGGQQRGEHAEPVRQRPGRRSGPGRSVPIFSSTPASSTDPPGRGDRVRRAAARCAAATSGTLTARPSTISVAATVCTVATCPPRPRAASVDEVGGAGAQRDQQQAEQHHRRAGARCRGRTGWRRPGGPPRHPAAARTAGAAPRAGGRRPRARRRTTSGSARPRTRRRTAAGPAR